MLPPAVPERVPAAGAALPRSLARALPLLLLLAGNLLLWFAGVSHRPLGEPDEGRYAEIAREMLAGGDWISPRLNGYLFMDKPPLQYWATALAYQLFGINPFSARLWSLLSGLLGVLSTGWMATRLYGWRCGLLSAGVLASSLLWVIASHTITTDMGVAALLNFGIACLGVAGLGDHPPPLQRRLRWLGWSGLALAMLAKGLISVVLPGLTLAAYLVWQRSWSLPRRLAIVRGGLLWLAIAAPWFVLMQWRHPEFFQYFFVREHFTRFLTHQDHRSHPLWFFVPVLAAGLLPWPALLDTASLRPRRAADRFLLSWAGTGFVFFSLSQSKLPFYILPVLPPLAVILARGALALPAQRLRRRLYGLATASLLLAAGLALYGRHAVWGEQPLFDATAARHAAAALLTLSVGSLLCARDQSSWSRLKTLLLLATFSLLSWQILLSTQDGALEKISARPVADALRPYVDQGARIYSVDRYLRGLPFYLHTPVILVAPRTDDILPGRQTVPAQDRPDLAGFEQQWRQSRQAAALVSPAALQHLQQDGLPLRRIGQSRYGILVARPRPAAGGSCLSP